MKEDKLDKDLPENIEYQSDKGYVTLPYNEDQFKDFVVGLLGKPQSISKSLYGIFEFKIEDLETLFYLINQRIYQQNDSKLIQFRATINYDDNSSVLVSSFEELITYKEIRKVISKSIDMSWQYLVKFQDKNVPERQEIEISIITSGSRFKRRIDSVPFPEMIERVHSSMINFHIKHTARTWGSDIESLLSNHFENNLKEVSGIKSFVRKNSGWISLLGGFTLFAASINGIRMALNKVQENLLNKVKEDFSKITDEGVQGLNEKYEYLTNYIIKHFSAQNDTVVLISTFAALIISIFLGIWISSQADTEQHSYLLLTKESKEDKIKKENSLVKKWRIFIVSIVVSILASIAANFVYAYLII